MYSTNDGQQRGCLVRATHNVLCRTFSAVCRKIANFCPSYFLTHDAAVRLLKNWKEQRSGELPGCKLHDWLQIAITCVQIRRKQWDCCHVARGSILTAGHLQATFSKLLTYCVLRSTQPPTLSGTGIE